MGFRRSVPWASQPQGAVGVDWRNPISRGLTVAFSGSVGLAELVSGSQQLTQNIGAGFQARQEGIDFISGGASFYAPNVNCNKAANGDWCLFVRAIAVGTGNPDVVCTVGTSGTWVWFGITGGNWIYDNNSSFTAAAASTTAYQTVVYNSVGGTLSIYVNGILSVSGADPNATFAGGLSLLKYGPNSGFAWQGGLKLFGFYSRGLSTAEVFSLSANPWQLFAPQRRSLGGITGTISRPGTDVSVAGWSFTAASLSASINEATRDDASYGQAPYGVAGAITTIDLPPLVAGSYTLSFAGQYLAANASSGQFRFTALDSSNTSLGVSAWTAVTSSAALYTVALTVSGGTATRLKIEIQA